MKDIDFYRLANVSKRDAGLKYDLYIHSYDGERRNQNMLIEFSIDDELQRIEIDSNKFLK